MLSVVVLTHNNEKTIERALRSVQFCDDLIIIDDESTDRTSEKVKKYPHSFIKSPLQGDFSKQRNKAMKQAQADWILFIDADEEVTEPLKDEIERVIENPEFDCYLVKRHDFWWGRELTHGEVATAARRGFIRLVKKGSGSFHGMVHEEFVTDHSVGQLKHHLNHYPHPTLTEFIQEVNYYSTLRSRELMKKGHQGTVTEILWLPFAKFIYTYFIKKGFKDGPAGFCYSFLMSFHSFLVRAKLYQYQHIDR